jgi:DNA adenine methylase
MTTLATGRKYRKLFKTHGGKNYLSRRFARLMPEVPVYVEPCAGGLSVMLARKPAKIEIANDVNADLINAYLMLQAHTDELITRLNAAPYTGETFQRALHFVPGNDLLENAVQYVIRNRFPRGGLGRHFAWSKRLRGGRPGDLNSWGKFVADLPRLADRLAQVKFECREALDVIQEYDDITMSAYLDPPYLPSTRTARHGVFTHDMSHEDHERLLTVITRCRGKIAISSYPNTLYDTTLAGWRKITFDLPNHSGQGKTKARRIEVLWMNF